MQKEGVKESFKCQEKTWQNCRWRTCNRLVTASYSKLHANESLCPYYRVLRSKSKSLHRMGKIFSYYVSHGTVKFIIQETSQPLSITHLSGLEKLFPDDDLSPTVWWLGLFRIAITRRRLRSLRCLGWTSWW